MQSLKKVQLQKTVSSESPHCRDQEYCENYEVDEDGFRSQASRRSAKTHCSKPFFCMDVTSQFFVLKFQAWANAVTGPKRQLENLDAKEFPSKNLIVVMTTDKGLCGGVNTILCRMTRQLMAKLDAEGKEYELYILGDKGRGQLRRLYGHKIGVTATERLLPYNFDLACTLTEDTLDEKFDSVHLLYNTFKSAISYVPMIKSITPKMDPAAEFFRSYEVEPEADADTLRNFHEYTMATQLFQSLLDNAASEQSSRMNAMENASKNAGEMIGKLTLQYNRARQARITTELIEIISGASALKG